MTSTTLTAWPNSIARKSIRELTAYSARGGASQALHLDANESPWTPPPSTLAVRGYNLYPQQQPSALRARLATLYGVMPETLMIGRGADEAIDILLRTFCEASEDTILICPPTFGYFKTAADIQGARVLTAPLNDNFTWDMEAIRETIKTQKPKLVFLCSPNNPTGNSLGHDAIKNLCADFPKTLIVVDEAYVEFSPQGSITALNSAYRNLVVLRTLSKAYGLAGVRMGVAIADPDIIKLMLKVLPPYPVPRPVEQAVMNALSPAAMGVYEDRLRLWISERARLLAVLERSTYIEKAWPSDGNFILFRAQNIPKLLKRLETYNVKLRDFRAKLPNCFRLSIGQPDENDILLTALGILQEIAPQERIGEAFRTTKETDIALRVNLDDPSGVKIQTGNGFFDHMLEQIAKHGGLGLTLTCKGDLDIDPHHTVEDTALALGQALKNALGDKAGIGRYGFIMPMDETQARIAIDLSGRPAAVFKGDFPTDHVGDFPVEMCPHFFQSLAQTLGAAIHIDVEGENSHHIIEACFKGVGRALRPAFARIGGDIPSTKGML